jgi:hypothetical protein
LYDILGDETSAIGEDDGDAGDTGDREGVGEGTKSGLGEDPLITFKFGAGP